MRLHVVTGKGGTGKSTVAAALALGLASQGKNVLLCEVEGRQGIARMFDVDPLPYEERRIATGLRHDGRPPGVVHALHIDPESALLEYLAMYYKLGRAGRALDRFGVIEFATTIAPGVRDVLLTGKVFEAVQRNSRNKSAIRYDAVVLDAPPTGRITQFLNVNEELAGLAKVGPIKSQSDTVMTLFRSPRTAVHLVTVLEEMPVQETADGIAELERARLPGGRRSSSTRCARATSRPVSSSPPGPAGSTRRAVAADLKEAGIDVDDGLVDGTARRGQRPRRDAAPSRTPSGPWSPGSGRRRTSCPGWPAASTSAVSTSSPPASRSRASHEDHRMKSRTRVGPLATSPGPAPAMDVDAPDRRPPHRHHRLLRLGRRRQDDHLGGARAASGGARPQGRRAHDRPGPPTRPVDGHRAARQHAPAGHRPAHQREGQPQAAAASTR